MKKGDKVVYIGEECLGIFNGDQFTVDIVYEGGIGVKELPHNIELEFHEVVLKIIYDSPLYKIMNEKG